MKILKTMALLFWGAVRHPRSTTVVYQDEDGRVFARHFTDK